MKFPRILTLVAGSALLCCASFAQSKAPFSPEPLKFADVGSAWTQTAGDINGDGLTDLVVSGVALEAPSAWQSLKVTLGIEPEPKGHLVWFSNPGWSAHTITTDYATSDDINVADIDGDGKNDVVLLTDEGVLWLKNPEWTPSPVIDANRFDELHVTDLDGNGLQDIALRGHGQRGADIVLYYQQEGGTWSHVTLNGPDGQGLAVTDMNGDGLDDVVVNGTGFINPGAPSDAWSRFTFAPDWTWPHVAIDAADVNQDGRTDLVLSPTQGAGERYALMWFEAPEQLSGAWTSHVIDAGVEATVNAVALRDVDLDHRIDVLTASQSPDSGAGEIRLYQMNSQGQWHSTVVSDQSGHTLLALDIDLDVDIDLVGADPRRPGGAEDQTGTLTVWHNQATEHSADKRWQRISIGSSLPSRPLLLFSADFNQDGHPDVATAGHWFEHSGDDLTQWTRHTLPERARNVVWVGDVDDDGDIDMVASEWSGRRKTPSFIDRALNRLNIREFDYKSGFYGERFNWGENDGSGNFTWHYNLPDASGDHDFLQGAVDIQTPTGKQVVLSWHHWKFPLEAYEIPEDPVNDPWRLVKLSDTVQGEEISAFDVDQDGLEDIVLGTVWMKNTPKGWEPQTLVDTDILPDRNVIADIDGDGTEDVVVGYEIVNVPGKLAWYGREADGSWKEHIISLDFVIGTSSVDVADVDMDSDMDVFVGEHNTKNEDRARVFWFENVNGDGTRWIAHLIHQGDEHHNGTVAVDLDDDGDMDLVSIGFRHDKVSAYINPTIP